MAANIPLAKIDAIIQWKGRQYSKYLWKITVHRKYYHF
jgi:hypothetical protein